MSTGSVVFSYFRQANDSEIEMRLVRPLKALIASCKNGVDVEIKEHTTRRSTAQNAFYWANLTDIAKVLSDAGMGYGDFNIAFTPEVLQEINKPVFGVKTTARMNSKDFTEYMDKVLAFWIEKTHGFFVPKETTKSYLEKTGLV